MEVNVMLNKFFSVKDARLNLLHLILQLAKILLIAVGRRHAGTADFKPLAHAQNLGDRHLI
ncbi:hypothetical protein D3C72_1984420 [compost metagenome]